jgi:ketosteroid isomerase-like protein
VQERSAKELAVGLIESFGDPDATVALMTEDCEWWVTPATGVLGSPTVGRDAIHAAMRTIYDTLYRDTAPVVRDVIGEGNQAAVRITFRAKARFAGDRPYENEYCLWVRARGGLIERVWEYLDVAHAASQFG